MQNSGFQILHVIFSWLLLSDTINDEQVYAASIITYMW